MSVDGASEGIMPSRVLRTILGGEPQPPMDDQNTPSTLSRMIEEASEPPPKNEDVSDSGYDEMCLYMAKWMCNTLRSDQSLSMNAAYDAAIKLGMKDVNPTGFMVGWSYNAARTVLSLPPVGNPAIVELRR